MKLKTLTAVMTATVCICMPAATTFANPTTFGPLPGATFGGTGNPNSAVEVGIATVGSDTITLGLAAQQRYQNPALGNDGNGTYFATTGVNYGNPANPTSTVGVSTTLGATWNFDYYVSIAGGGNLSDYSFVLQYALIPGAAPIGSLNVNGIAPYLGFSPTGTIVQDSENLDFSFLGTSIPGLVSPPSGSFDPNATGNYAFLLDAYDGSTLVDQVAITVNVSAASAVGDSNGTNISLLLGLASLGLYCKLKV